MMTDSFEEHGFDPMNAIKFFAMTVAESLSSLSEDWSVTNHGTDGDTSDGISVISDCNSDSGRHSPEAMTMTSLNPRSDETDEKARKNESSGAEDLNNHTLANPSMTNNKQFYIMCMILVALFGIILQNRSQISSLAQRNQDLESENLALKVEVNRLVAEVTQKYLEIESMEKKLEKLVEKHIEITMRQEQAMRVSYISGCAFCIVISIIFILIYRNKGN